MTKKMLEADVKHMVKGILRSFNVFYWMPVPGGYGINGVSDFCALHNGKFIAIETKVGDRKPTRLQQQFMAKVVDAGGHALLINETNLWELTKLLESLKD